MRRLCLVAVFALAACGGGKTNTTTAGSTSGATSTGTTATGATATGTTSTGASSTGSSGTTSRTSATASSSGTTAASTTAASTTAASTTASSTSATTGATTGTTAGSTTGSTTTGTTGTGTTTGTNGSSTPVNFTKVVSLHAVTRTSVVVFFHTDVSIVAGVDYAPASGGALQSTSDSTATDQHAIQLTGLTPNTKYTYTVYVGTATASGDFTTAPDAATNPVPFTFAVVGDTRNLGDWSTVASAILAKQPRFIVQTGDNDSNWFNSDQAWRDYYSSATDLFAHVPVFAAQGNHDTVPEYSTYNIAPQSSSNSDTYYAFVYGNAGFVAIDGNSSSSAQSSWVQTALSTLSGGPLFAFQHQPLYSCGNHGSSTSMQNLYQSTFESNHLTTNFTGHDHDLIYWTPINGVNYVVSGGGGSTLYGLNGCQGPFSNQSLGFMLVTVNGASVTQAFYDQTGAQLFTDNVTAFGPSVNFANLGNLVVY